LVAKMTTVHSQQIIDIFIPLFETWPVGLALEHQFTQDQLAYITELRERQSQSWSQIKTAFNGRFGTNLSVDEIRWAYSNLC
ncbi:MAG: hypothetical protein M1835_006423, partial [Candelina submexicana]